jgi:membrane dipeptidase
MDGMKPLALAALVLAVPAALSAADDAALVRARRILATTPLIDGHNDLPWAIREYEKAPHDVAAYDLRSRTPGHTDLARLRAGQVGGQFWSVYVPGEIKVGYARVQLEQIDIARQVIARYPERLGLALTAADVLREFKRGRVASLLGMEGGHVIENSLGALRAYYDLGARYMTLTHNVTLDWADTAAEPGKHGGLTRFGEEVVREMNRLGMLVDLSHVSIETMDDALRVSEAPVIFSHSSARALTDVPRNVPDAILKRMPANGGVVMVTFVPGFVSKEIYDAYVVREKRITDRTASLPSEAERKKVRKQMEAAEPLPTATLAQVADHVEYVRKVAGADHVGIGSDFDGIDIGPVGLEDVSKYPALFAELVRRGWSDADLRKLAGENVLRVMRQAEAVSKRLRAARPASTATIESMDGAPAARATSASGARVR